MILDLYQNCTILHDVLKRENPMILFLILRPETRSGDNHESQKRDLVLLDTITLRRELALLEQKLGYRRFVCPVIEIKKVMSGRFGNVLILRDTDY